MSTLRQTLLTCLTATLVACGGGAGGSDTPVDPGTTAKGSIQGVVQDENAAPVAGAQVQITATGGATRSRTSGVDGSYGFTDVPIGVWQMSVTPPAGFTAASLPSVAVTAGQQTTVPAIILSRQNTTAPLSASVSMSGTTFQPGDVTIRQGGSVTWTNNDNIAHTATSGGFDTGVLNNGQSSTKVFNTAGTFGYACSFHPGMTGRVIVQ